MSKQRKGLAVAEARDGGCTVCHVRMRPQMFNEVRRGETLIQCESCLRILYFVPQDAATQRVLITAYIDGGARGNPGPAGYGVYIQGPDATPIAELHGGLGVATNNVAEYNGLLAALRWAMEHGHRKVHIRADSELLVKQMRGEYRVKNEGLKPLFLQAYALIRTHWGRHIRARPAGDEHGRRSSVEPRHGRGRGHAEG